jgi:phage baseplate assembly protein W
MATSNYIDPVSWPYLPLPQNGQLVYPTLEQSVRDSIRIILTTRPGEQLMRSRFGAGLQDFLQDGNTISVRRQIQSTILQNLTAYETRMVVDRVDVDPVPNAPSEVHVQIYYRLLRTNAAQQIGITMQVG